jgi:Secretion system C-terminal sorting domain
MDVVACNGGFWWYVNEVVQQSVSATDAPAPDMAVFPNPFQDAIFFPDALEDKYMVRITDVSGMQVYATRLTSQRLDLSHLKPGAYFLQLTDPATRRSVGSVALIKRD